MKATDKFKQDFRPTTRSKQEEDCQNSSTLLSSDDVLMRTRLTFNRIGLSTSIVSLQNPCIMNISTTNNPILNDVNEDGSQIIMGGTQLPWRNSPGGIYRGIRGLPCRLQLAAGKPFL